MSHALIIRVQFHEGRYHGAGAWPPSPARLFQALVAAAGLNGQLAAARDSLEWFESLPTAPIIGAPSARRGQRVMFYMPNNDLDAVQGDPRRVAEIRTARKFFSPWLFDAATPLVYVWQDVAAADQQHAHAIVSLADQLYQLGRGIDMAWAWGELLDNSRVSDVLASHAGPLYRPSSVGGGTTLPCPQPGSLASTETRYQAYRRRFEVAGKGKTVKFTFRQAPRSQFRSVSYESPPSRSVYELRAPSIEANLASWPLVEVSKLVVHLRNGAFERLATALPAQKAEIARVLVGRTPDGTNDGRTTERVRIVPLPSIGHPHADRAIRRVMVEVPAGCSIRAEDLAWAFSGLEPINSDTGEVYPVILTPVLTDGMLRHYSIDEDAGARTWRTVTPAALPNVASRRRIDPARKLVEAKGGVERAWEQRRAAATVVQALRHADVRARLESIRVQREPFEGSGERVEAFAAGTRFPKERLWHVEIRFTEPVSGPLVVGDGRFLGLGLMAPVRDDVGAFAFGIEDGLTREPSPEGLARALRRAVMARVQVELGPRAELPTFFSGHADGGERATSPHLAYLYDPPRQRLLVLAPHLLEHRAAKPYEWRYIEVLGRALARFEDLRAGTAARLRLCPIALDFEADALFAPARRWETVTTYTVTRHLKTGTKETAIADLMGQCREIGVPSPRVMTRNSRGIPGRGLVTEATLEFETAVSGPILLGRMRHLGGGVFAGVHEDHRPKE